MGKEYAGPFDAPGEPDYDTIVEFLTFLYGDYSPMLKARFDVCTTNPATGSPSVSRKFDLGDLEDAAEYIVEQNKTPGANVYIRPGVIPPDKTGPVTDKDVFRFFTNWADADHEGGLKHMVDGSRERGVKPNYVTVTGEVPYLRGHCLYKFTEVETSGLTIQKTNKAIAEAFGSDATVANPSRMLRVPGTIAWPYKEGRRVELTRGKAFGGAYTDMQLRAAFPWASQTPDKKERETGGDAVGSDAAGFDFDAGGVDVVQMIKKIKKDDDWHDNALRVVAHWVNRGLSDIEIRMMARQFTVAGYTHEDTDQDVRTMIRTARNKWNVENPTHVIGRPEDDDPFGEPADLTATTIAPRMREDMIPPALRPYCRAVADVIGVPVEGVFMATVAAAVGAMDDRIAIQPHDRNEGWMESARLWLMLIGPPSVKKTPVLNAALKPLRDLNRETMEEVAGERARYEQALKEYKKAMSIIERENGKAIAAGEQPNRDNMPEPPDHPRLDRFLVDDATVEALARILQWTPRGTMVQQDELSGWFGSHDAYSGNKSGAKDRSHWLRGYNGGAHTVDRVGAGTLVIPNWAVSMVGGIQPGALANVYQTLPSDGLLQRFYPFILPPSKAGGKNEGVPPDVDMDYRRLIYSIARTEPGLAVETPVECSRIIDDYADELRGIQNHYTTPAALADHIGKWEGGMYRWALVFHVVECLADNTSPFTLPISVDTARRVVDLHRDYFMPGLRALYGEILADAGCSKHVRWIAGHILAHEITAFTISDIVRKYKPWRELSDRDKAEVIGNLEAAGWIRPADGKGGLLVALRMPSKWVVNPNVHTLFTRQAELERSRRKEQQRNIVEGGRQDAGEEVSDA